MGEHELKATQPGGHEPDTCKITTLTLRTADMSSSMEFWASCVKPNKPVKVDVGEGKRLLLTQVAPPLHARGAGGTRACWLQRSGCSAARGRESGSRARRAPREAVW